MAFLDKIIAAKAKEFNLKRRFFFPDNSTCFLLSLNGDEVSFIEILEIGSGWYLEYSKFRERFEFFYAESQTNFKNKLKLSSHIAVNADVYEISAGDTVPPQGEEPFWRIACTATGKQFESP